MQHVYASCSYRDDVDFEEGINETTYHKYKILRALIAAYYLLMYLPAVGIMYLLFIY